MNNYSNSNKLLFFLFQISVVWIAFSSFKLSFTQDIDTIANYIVSTVFILFYLLLSYKNFIFSKKKLFLCFIFGLITIYQLLFCVEFNEVIGIFYFSRFLSISILVLSNDKVKIKVLRFMTKSLGILLAISLFGYVLYILGLNMPYKITYDGFFYYHKDYYLFRININEVTDLFTRFTGMFLEPGHLGTTCVFMLFINKFNLRKWESIVMLISIFLSYSLAAYGLLLISFFLFMILFTKNRKLYISLFIIIVISITMLLIRINNTNNALYQLIISRLEKDETKLIVGNNRYIDLFDTKYYSFIRSNDKYLGIGNTPEEQKWWRESSGWKRSLVVYGIVGTTLILLFYFITLKNDWSITGLCFLIIFLIANIIRDHLLKEYWLYIFVLSLPLLKSYKIFQKNNNSIANITDK